jgi:hypothetical protein
MNLMAHGSWAYMAAVEPRVCLACKPAQPAATRAHTDTDTDTHDACPLAVSRQQRRVGQVQSTQEHMGLQRCCGAEWLACHQLVRGGKGYMAPETGPLRVERGPRQFAGTQVPGLGVGRVTYYLPLPAARANPARPAKSLVSSPNERRRGSHVRSTCKKGFALTPRIASRTPLTTPSSGEDSAGLPSEKRPACLARHRPKRVCQPAAGKATGPARGTAMASCRR